MSENDRNRLIEVPFTFTISGTRMVIATDEAKAKEIVEDSMVFDEDWLNESNVLWEKQEKIVLKDGIRCTRTIDAAVVSQADPSDYEDAFGETDFSLLGLPDDDSDADDDGIEDKDDDLPQTPSTQTPKPAPTPSTPPRPNAPTMTMGPRPGVPGSPFSSSSPPASGTASGNPEGGPAPTVPPKK